MLMAGNSAACQESTPSTVMPALVAGIHVLTVVKDVDGRDKPGHDEKLSAAQVSLFAGAESDQLPASPSLPDCTSR